MERKEEFEALGLQIKNLEEEQEVLSEKQLELYKQRRILFDAEIKARYSLQVGSIVEREGENFVVVSIEVDRGIFDFPRLPEICVNRILNNGRKSTHRDYFVSNYKVVAPSSVVQNGVVVFGEWRYAREQGASWGKAKIRFLTEDMKKDLEKQKVESDLLTRWNLEKELLNFSNLALDQKKELVELLEKFSTARKMKNV